MIMTTSVLEREVGFAADAVNELLDFVVRDRRFPEIGLRGAIKVVLGRRLGCPPSEELVTIMARAFWDAWDDRFCEYDDAPPLAAATSDDD
jgi:hypothetical protein